VKPLYTFVSHDHRYGVALPQSVVQDMLIQARASNSLETGGILIGTYNERHDTALVSRADGPPPDSKATSHRFWRGVQGLAEALQRRWSRPIRTFYLGEWHYHPFSSPERSALDDATMVDTGLHSGFGCEVPVLVILGGDPGGAWTLRAWAYPNSHMPTALLELFPQNQE